MQDQKGEGLLCWEAKETGMDSTLASTTLIIADIGRENLDLEKLRDVIRAIALTGVLAASVDGRGTRLTSNGTTKR